MWAELIFKPILVYCSLSFYTILPLFVGLIEDTIISGPGYLRPPNAPRSFTIFGTKPCFTANKHNQRAYTRKKFSEDHLKAYYSCMKLRSKKMQRKDQAWSLCRWGLQIPSGPVSCTLLVIFWSLSNLNQWLYLKSCKRITSHCSN
jgi:hypothetical protein